ncbi:MAG: hypothetical protein KME26_03260 [Oscillatoria princeps RMCB-10]|nr:hypothetical protein [Oscillatoria princeps RMCB-10]
MTLIALVGHSGGGKSSAAVASSVPTGGWGCLQVAGTGFPEQSAFLNTAPASWL